MQFGERFNVITHLAGTLLAVCGSAFLIVLAARGGDPWKIVSLSVYGVMLSVLYTTSTLYHGVGGSAKNVLRKFDHCAIYLLIAGSYTPFTLVTLRGSLGWSLFGTIWALAAIGIAQEIWLARGARISSLIIYVAMGWLALVAIVPLSATLSRNGLVWLIAGGMVYTIGIVFYALDERIPHGHGIWHLFVLGGSACHYSAIAFDVL
jgi:hemolysin III